MRYLGLAALLLAGCDYYAKPNVEVSREFKAQTLSGEPFGREELKGSPWAITLWVPG